MEDIHNSEHRCELNKQKLKDSEKVSTENKEAIQRFIDKSFAEGISNWSEYREAKTEIEETEYKKHKGLREIQLFPGIVKQAYDYSCAICGAKRFSSIGQPEAEAAHIYLKSENGADDPRNGISLCKFHHWALTKVGFQSQIILS